MSNSGWNRSSSNQPKVTKKGEKKFSLLHGLIAGGVVVLAACATLFFLFSGGDDKPAQGTRHKAQGTIKEVTPAAAPKYKEEPKVDDEKERRKARREKIKKMTPDERWAFFVEEMKKRPLDLTPTTNHTFKTATEQMLAMMFNKRLGDMPPPLPVTSDFDLAHFAEILIADNPVLETDTEAQRNAKAVVQEAKKELREYIKGGGEPDEFFAYYHGQLSQAFNEWQDCQKSALRLIHDDPDIAADYIAEVNARLAKKGIKPVVVPPKLAEKIGLETNPQTEN